MYIYVAVVWAHDVWCRCVCAYLTMCRDQRNVLTLHTVTLPFTPLRQVRAILLSLLPQPQDWVYHYVQLCRWELKSQLRPSSL